MAFSLQRYAKLSLINLLIVAFIGFVLRYKIVFSVPFVNQKHLLHGHSHFAFTGWVTQALMVLLVNYVSNKKQQLVAAKYKWLLLANLITAYGMLLSFPLQGYGLISISFSTASIFVSYAFAFFLWKDLTSISSKSVSHWWMKAALFFNILSSAGAFSLAFMMATKTVHQNWYLAAVYFYLHFQYNGWFLFACMGLISAKFLNNIPLKKQQLVFWLFAAACIPAYVLSALWLPIPAWAYIIVIIAAISQFTGWLILLQQLKIQQAFKKSFINNPVQFILLLAGVALTIKLLLQLGSTIPVLSTMAFGFRPIVIGYLHLILLGVITLGLLGLYMHEKYIQDSKKTVTAVNIFITGIVINELLLMLQGVAAIFYIPLNFINELLLAAAALLFTGILMILVYKNKNTM